MNMLNTQQNILKYSKISLILRLAALWTSFMFSYLYVDYLALYTPEKIKDILTGKVFVFGIIL